MSTIESIVLSDPRDTETLIAQALSMDIDIDNRRFWAVIRVLQPRFPEIFPRLQALAQESDAKSQEVAAIILGQNLQREKKLVPECTKTLSQLLHPEANASVLYSVILSLGHLDDSSYTELILPYYEHTDSKVRDAVASSLKSWKGEPSIMALIALSSDADFDVRNWATFGLRCAIDLNVDTEEIRQALLARLSDSEEEVRGEAFIGLVERRDSRVIEPLLAELAKQKRFPEILECIDMLNENKQKCDVCWQPIFEALTPSQSC